MEESSRRRFARYVHVKNWNWLFYCSNIAKSENAMLYTGNLYRNGFMQRVNVSPLFLFPLNPVISWKWTENSLVWLEYISVLCLKIDICCFSAKHAALRRKSKDWLARNQNVSVIVDHFPCLPSSWPFHSFPLETAKIV